MKNKNSATVAAVVLICLCICLYLLPFPHEWAWCVFFFLYFVLWNNAIHFLYTVFILFILIEHYAWFEHTFLCQWQTVSLSLSLFYVYGVLFGRFLQTVGFYVARHTTHCNNKHFCNTGENRFVCAYATCHGVALFHIILLLYRIHHTLCISVPVCNVAYRK